MKATFLMLLIFLSVESFGQEYQVIHVKGEIIRTGSGQPLKAGDKVSSDEEINFKSKNAMAAVLNPDLGRFILKADSDESNSGNLVYVLKSTITPVRGGMSTRAAGINNAFDLKVYFAEAPFVWAGEIISLKISVAAFPQDESNFFFLRYDLNGELINKKLPHEEDKLIMKKNEVFKVDDQSINPLEAKDFELYYYQSEKEESQLITGIDFVLIDQESVLNVYNSLKDQSKYPFNDVADLFSSMYGKCDPVQVQNNLMNQ